VAKLDNHPDVSTPKNVIDGK